MGKLVVIGGTGFFGQSILSSYAAGGLKRHGVDSLAVIARHATAFRAALPTCGERAVEYVDCDVRSLTTLAGADVVIHAAASSDARRYRVDPDGEQSIIVEGTARVLELIARSGRPVKLLYVSSGAVYGRQPPDVAALTEDTPFASEPDSARRAYTNAKRSAEDQVMAASATDAIAASIARCFAFVGPALPLDQHFAIGNFIGDALNKHPIIVTSPGRDIRSYMFADDLVDWLLAIAASSTTECPIFNVGSEEPVRIRDLAALIGEIANVDVTLPDLDKAEVFNRYVPSTGRARSQLGVSLRYPLRQAIEETMRRWLERLGRPRTQDKHLVLHTA